MPDSGEWRTGRKVGRTVYIGDHLVGLMDTPELAAIVVEAVNGLPRRAEMIEQGTTTPAAVSRAGHPGGGEKN